MILAYGGWIAGGRQKNYYRNFRNEYDNEANKATDTKQCLSKGIDTIVFWISYQEKKSLL